MSDIFTFPYSCTKIKVAFSREQAVALAAAPLEPWPQVFDEAQKWRAATRTRDRIADSAFLRQQSCFIHYEELLVRKWNGRKTHEDPKALPDFLEAWLKHNGYTFSLKQNGFEVYW